MNRAEIAANINANGAATYVNRDCSVIAAMVRAANVPTQLKIIKTAGMIARRTSPASMTLNLSGLADNHSAALSIASYSARLRLRTFSLRFARHACQRGVSRFAEIESGTESMAPMTRKTNSVSMHSSGFTRPVF